MNDDEHDEPQRKTVGRPFKPGDSRINKKGRPRSFDEFRKIAQRISHESVVGADGSTITRAELLLRSWAKSKNPLLQKLFAEYAFGPPPTKIEAEGLEPKTRLILHFAHEEPGYFDKKFGDAAAVARILPDSASSNEGTRKPLLPDAD